MCRSVSILAAALFCSALSARAEVPEKYFGTWVLDIEASTKEVADHAPAQVKESWLKIVADLIRYEWVISADTILASNTTKSTFPF